MAEQARLVAANDEIDTIVAVATPPGVGGIGIIRISGPATLYIAQTVLGILPEPRTAIFRSFFDNTGQILDQGIALYFPAPDSYTAEHVLELQAHGSPVVLDMLLKTICQAGARLARPGEFTERAFLNNKLDLAQAEAVADLINAGSIAAARGAARSLQGEFSKAVYALVERLIELRTYVEVAIDFPDEDIDLLESAGIAGQLNTLASAIQALRAQTEQGVVLREGVRVVLSGPPNAGKSSLLNALVRYDAALVTDVAGTTRDIIRERLNLDGMPLEIADTAGLRDSHDPIEQMGMSRAREAAATADIVLIVLDDNEALDNQMPDVPTDATRITVRNKIDLSGTLPRYVQDGDTHTVWMSAKTGEGMDNLRYALRTAAGYEPKETLFMARRRHLEAIDTCARHVHAARELIDHNPDLVLIAEELRLAHRHIGEVVGEFTTEDLLGAIFSSFCIGK
ncbi:MAG: tRNA uridine-5-carboxymethylaminomethyl(34) synthesis GTPase MnmE [Gammaproteobacteria bacterium]|nr:tRNA uridine-5-carboxymethylaminomethyl(34) synthesis GTPase MnmE [Gammaproteobacteria bacterium]